MSRRKLLPLTLISLLFSATAGAQSGESYYWYENGVKHELFIQPDLVVEFDQAGSSRQSLQKASGVSLLDRSGRARLYRVEPEQQDSMQASLKASSVVGNLRSPVFSSSSEGGVLRGLPGGVLVSFLSPKSTEEISEWCREHGLELDKLLAIDRPQTILVKTAAGVASLSEANRIRQLAGVAEATPNWWTQRWKGEFKPRNRSQQEEKSARESRERMSRKFSQ